MGAGGPVRAPGTGGGDPGPGFSPDPGFRGPGPAGWAEQQFSGPLTFQHSPHWRTVASGGRGVIPLSADDVTSARYLTVREVATTLRVSNMTVYRLINAGELPAVRVGKSFRLREDDVNRYLADRYTQAG
ncbi:MAG TPA: helix-turn-helix domain-containing protein [Acidimicrobiales bacterium]